MTGVEVPLVALISPLAQLYLQPVSKAQLHGMLDPLRHTRYVMYPRLGVLGIHHPAGPGPKPFRVPIVERVSGGGQHDPHRWR